MRFTNWLFAKEKRTTASPPVVNEIGHSSARQTLPAVLQALESPESSIRWDAHNRLKQILCDSLVDDVLLALRSGSKCLRSRALSVFVDSEFCDLRAFEVLVDALSDADTFASAAFGLGKLADERAVEPLTAALDGQNGCDAANALVKIQGKRAIPALLLALERNWKRSWKHSTFSVPLEAGDPDWGQLLAARDLLDELLIGLTDSDKNIKSNAIWLLGSAKCERAVEPLVEALGDLDLKPGSHNRPDQALDLIDQHWRTSPKARSMALRFINLLDDKNDDAVQGAVHALGQMRSLEALQSLRQLLRHRNPKVRQETHDALGRISAVADLTTLTDALNDQAIRSCTAGYLGQHGLPAALETLSRVARETHQQVDELYKLKKFEQLFRGQVSHADRVVETMANTFRDQMVKAGRNAATTYDGERLFLQLVEEAIAKIRQRHPVEGPRPA